MSRPIDSSQPPAYSEVYNSSNATAPPEGMSFICHVWSFIVENSDKKPFVQSRMSHLLWLAYLIYIDIVRFRFRRADLQRSNVSISSSLSAILSSGPSTCFGSANWLWHNKSTDGFRSNSDLTHWRLPSLPHRCPGRWLHMLRIMLRNFLFPVGYSLLFGNEN